MSLVPSLLQAIVSLDGQACVIHVGEKPYVVAPSGQVDLATRGLTFEAVNGILEQLLPIESQNALDEFGAIQYELPPQPDLNYEHFTVVVARGGDDIWVEIRRRSAPDQDRVPADAFLTTSVMPAHDPEPMERGDEALELPDMADLWPDDRTDAAATVTLLEESSEYEILLPASIEIDQPPRPSLYAVPRFEPEPEEPLEREPEPLVAETPPIAYIPPIVQAPFVPPPTPMPVAQTPPIVLAPVAPAPAPPVAEAPPIMRAPVVPAAAPPPVAEAPPIMRAPVEPVPAPPPVAEAPPIMRAPVLPAPAPPPVAPVQFVPTQLVASAPPSPKPAPAPAKPAAPPVKFPPPPSHQPLQPAVVLPLSRSPVRTDTPPPLAGASMSGLDRLLRVAAARGASTLYLASLARPSIRVDGEIQMLEEAALGPSDVESLLIDLMPERNREALRSGVSTEWICDVTDVGRVRCMTFRDHRGAGGIFRMMPVRAISADQLGLSREIQALAAEPEGLVLVAGPRSSGKDTLISAFVDLINRTRRDHVITIESEIKVVHENRHSLISQREVRGNNEEMLAVVRGAIRENPDVLVIEDLRTADMISAALDAANSGHLVISALSAHTATGAIDRIIDVYPPEDRRHVQLALAENLRGVVAQVLLRRPGGGRLAAREVLLNTSAVASVIAEGKTSQLPLAMESGRKHGMVPLNDALVGIVQSGAVDAREAYRRAADRAGFLALLKRQGVDVSFAERLA
jgi:twitching motility protein PilT